MDLTAWHTKAACYNAWNDGVDFFPPYSQAEANEVINSYCVACPVKYECALEALDTRGVEGIWAGAWFPPHGGKQHAKRRAEAYRIVNAIVSSQKDDAA